MSSSNSNPEVVEPIREPSSVGSQLRAAREQAGIAIDELARRLCMTPEKLEALERDDFARLAGATYVRGYLRNACKELKLDAAPLLETFAQQVPSEAVAHVPEMPRGAVMAGGRGHGEGGSLFRPALLALTIAAAGGYWWFGLQGGETTPAVDPAMLEASSERNFTTKANPAPAADFESEFDLADTAREQEFPIEGAPVDEVQPQTDAELELADEALVEPSADPVSEPESEPQPVVSEPLASAAPAAPVAEAAPTVSTSGQALSLVFSEESWVEVVDATGNKLLAKLQPAGSTVELTGEAPFSLMLGNAAATTVSYAGEVVDSRPLGNRRTRKLTVGG